MFAGGRSCRTVYDVANRETFDALPKWFTEIDTYVSTTVPKIIVGNKLDKVSLHRSHRAASEQWTGALAASTHG